MKAKDKSEKEHIKLRFAVALNKVLADSKLSSFRSLALDSGLEPAHIQRITAGKVDAALTTIVAISEGFNIPLAKISSYYDDVTDKDVREYIKMKEEEEKEKGEEEC